MRCHLKAWPKIVSAIGFSVVGLSLILPETTFAQKAKLEATLQGDQLEDYVDFLAFSPDGKTLAQSGGATILWDLGTLKPRITLKTDRMFGSQIAFSPDGKNLGAAADDNEAIILYNVATGEKGATFVGRLTGCYTPQAAFSPDGKILAAWLGGRVLQFWDVNSRKNIANAELLNDQRVDAISFTRDSKNLVTICPNHGINRWDAATGKKTTMLKAADAARLEMLVNRLGSAEASDRDKAASEILDMGPVTLDILEQARKHESKAVSERAAKLITLLKAKDVSARRFTTVAFRMDCKTLATASWDAAEKRGFVKLWDVASGKELDELKGLMKSPVYSLVLSPNGKMLAVGFKDGTIKLWDLTASKEPVTFEAHAKPTSCMAFSPNSKTLASGDGHGTIKLWGIAPAK